LQRFVYTPFGEVDIRNADWSAAAGAVAAWQHLFQGLKFSDVTGLAYVRNRDYSASLGRFIELDPIGFSAGDNNWYRFVANGPTSHTDAFGLFVHPNDIMTPAGCKKWKLDRLQELYQHLSPANPAFHDVLEAIMKAFAKCIKRTKAQQPDCTFMVRGDVTGNATGDACGFKHVDLYSTCNGELRTGFGGSVLPEYVPTTPTPIDPVRDTILTVSTAGALAHGASAGTPCHQATHEQIVACIVAAPRPEGNYNMFTNNCRHDVSAVAKACCLVGF
jgi:RHS repeat-associated protein